MLAEVIEHHADRLYSLEDFPPLSQVADAGATNVVPIKPKGAKRDTSQSADLLSKIMKDYLAGVTVEVIRVDYMDHPHVLGKPKDVEKFRALDRSI